MNRVLGYRKMLNITQKQMAKEFNISEQTYRNKERGKAEFKKNEMLKFKNMLVDSGLSDVSIEDIFFN